MRKLLPPLLAALACAACTNPVFDPDVIAAIRTIDASRVLGVTVPSTGPKDESYDPRWDSFVFLPERSGGELLRGPGGLLPRGFVICRREEESWNNIWYQWLDNGSVSWMGTPAGFHETDGLPRQWPVMLKNGPYLGAVIFEDTMTRVEVLYADIDARYCDWYPWWGAYDLINDIKSDLGIGFDLIAVGLSVQSFDLPAYDRMHVLAKNNSSPQFTEARAQVDGVTNPFFVPPFGATNYALDFLPPDQRPLGYFYDAQNGRSFAQWMDWDGWRAWTWWGTTPGESAQLANVTHRIDAVLTTLPAWGWSPGSYLFSVDKQVARLYRYDAGTDTLVAEFPLGSLAFIGEMYLDGEWQLVFSRKVLSGDSMYFEVRGISTRDLIDDFGM